jgi:hypothetical protein
MPHTPFVFHVGIDHVCQEESYNAQSKRQPTPLSKNVIHSSRGSRANGRGGNGKTSKAEVRGEERREEERK